MGIYFRKSKRVGPLRFTASKRGISTSIGGGPFRVTRGAGGRVRGTARIPGTGIYATSNLTGNRRRRRTTRDSGPSPSFIALTLFGVAVWFIAHNLRAVLAIAALLVGVWVLVMVVKSVGQSRRKPVELTQPETPPIAPPPQAPFLYTQPDVPDTPQE